MQSHNPEMSIVTGPQAHVKSVVRAMERRGHRVRMVARQQGRVQVSDDLEQWRPGQFLNSRKLPFLIVERMVQAIQGRFYLPWLHLFDSYRFSDACVTALAGYDVLYERYGFLGYGGVMAAKRLRIPVILEVNGDIVEDYERRGIKLSRAQWATAHRITRLTYNQAAHVIAVDDAVKSRIVQRWGIDPAHITVIQNGAEYELFAARHDQSLVRQKFNLPAGKLVTFVGGFKPWHGTDVLTKAFKQVCAQMGDIQLLLIGDGPDRENTVQIAKELGLNGQVTFTGRIQQHEVAELLSISEVAVAPYRVDQWRELAGLKLYDYLAAGKAIVASAQNNRHPVLEHMKTGLLVKPSNETELAQMLALVLADERLRQQLGDNAQALSRSKYTWDHTVARIEALCLEHCERRPQ